MSNKGNNDNIGNIGNKGNIVIYTVPELSKLLNLTPQSVRRYINTGKIRGTKAGRQWLVDEDAVKEFLRGDND